MRTYALMLCIKKQREKEVSEIAQPSEVVAMLKVVGFILVGIGFALEGNREVSAHEMAMLNEPDEPFEYIEDVEGYVEQLAHLTRVDAFVTQVNLCEFMPFTDEDEAEEIDGKESAEGDETIEDDHRLGQLKLEGLAQTDQAWIQIAEMTQLLPLVVAAHGHLFALDHLTTDGDVAIVKRFLQELLEFGQLGIQHRGDVLILDVKENGRFVVFGEAWLHDAHVLRESRIGHRQLLDEELPLQQEIVEREGLLLQRLRLGGSGFGLVAGRSCWRSLAAQMANRGSQLVKVQRRSFADRSGWTLGDCYIRGRLRGLTGLWRLRRWGSRSSRRGG